MTIDRKVSYIAHQFVEKYPFKGAKSIAYAISKTLLPINSNNVLIENRDHQKVILSPKIGKGVEESIYFTGTYEAGVQEVMSKFLNKGDTFIEVGANVAPHSFKASKLVGSKGKVVAFEPDPSICRIVRESAKINRIKNIEVANFGLGDRNERLRLYKVPEINRGASSLLKKSSSDFVEVEVKILDTSFGKLGIKDCRMAVIDVEGWEMHVLRGARGFLFKFQPLISLEINRDNNPRGLYNLLSQFPFYSVYQLIKNKEYISNLRIINSFEEIRLDDNIFCLTKHHVNTLSSIIS